VWLAATAQHHQVTPHKQIQLGSRRIWRKPREEVEYAALERVSRMNNRRQLQPICNIQTVELERRYYECITTSIMVS
jgi:hypothetical protein